MKIKQAHCVRAFTLIELLMVIAIIGILAGLVLAGVKYASGAKKKVLVGGTRESLMSAIDSYHASYGSYPPDNPMIATATNQDQAGVIASTNQLFYELFGATYDPNTATYAAHDGSTISAAVISSTFGGIGGIRNSLAGEVKSFWNPPPQTNYYLPYPNGAQAFVVLVPFDPNSSSPNRWHYDASSTYRHNKQSYDLWAVYNDGGTLITNGNWKQ